MREGFEPTQVLVTVMTYPHPSKKHQEVICTAGVTAEGRWIRLYPIDYRYLPEEKQFKKYQWIEVTLSPHGAQNDKRKESRKPDLSSIRLLGDRLGTENAWDERRKLVDKLPVFTLDQLKELFDRERVSLGVVRPTEVLDLEIEEDDPEWDPKWLELFKQGHLFGQELKTLRKIPYKFTYVFECKGSSKPHKARLIDWEMGALWLKQANRLQDEKRAAESVKQKFLEEICRADKDTRFYMGTRHPWNTWMVLGVFWPPKLVQQRLF